MAKKHLPKLAVCQNCETSTTGNYCPECGQDCRDHRVGLRLLMGGLWNDLFTFDNRFWRSFVILLCKPGELTMRYMGGKRVRYIPPLRMYIFVSIIFFFVLSATTRNGQNVEIDSDDENQASEVIALADSLSSESAENAGGNNTVNGTTFGQNFELDKDDLLATMFNLAPKGMFLLLPVFAALLALIYRRSKCLFVEHFIFSLHFHTLVFVALIVTMLVPWDWFVIVAWVGFNTYLYLAMKRVYGQGWLKTLLKHFLLLSTYNGVLFVLLVTIGVGSIYLTSWLADHPEWGGWLG